jgi:ribosomal protein L11 methyltransferase
MAGNWTKLTAKGKTENLDDICAVMSMIDNGIMIEDYSDFSFSGMYGELVDESILNADKTTVSVSVFIPEEKNLAECRSFAIERFGTLGIDAVISVEGINEDDWAESWKQYYKPIPLGKVTIVPAWEEYTARKDETVIRMDPGMAFGTGTHETTRLVIRLMQEYSLVGKEVLDIGCGSGILSICASKLGAKSCNAYDIDPVAVKVTRENAKDGGCDNITAGVSDLLSGVERKTEGYDVCFANIVADIIVRMLPDIRPYLKEGAPIILSGIIEPSADMVRQKVYECGFSIVKEEKENDWVALIIK